MSLLREAEKNIRNQKSLRVLNAFISSVTNEQVLLQNVHGADDRRTRGNPRSPIDGHTVSIKDNICTEDCPTSCASKILDGYHSPYPATVVTKLRDAGAVVVGKTTLDEFGMGSHSINSAHENVLNAKNRNLSAGGSSGGSAVAVASGQCTIALGTDTGGSVRLPAAYNGIVGFKPSYGLISRWGVVAYANSLDTVGILASSVDLAHKTFSVLNAFDKQDPTSLPLSSRARITSKVAQLQQKRPWRIGIPREYNIQEMSGAVRRTWQKTIEKIHKAGHSIQEISLPSTEQALSAYYVLAPAEASSNLAKYDGVRYGVRPDASDTHGGVLYSNTRGLGLGDEVKKRILLGSYSLSANAIDNYFLKAQLVRKVVQNDFDKVFASSNPLHDMTAMKDSGAHGVDVLLCPTAPTLPPSIESVQLQTSIESYMNDVLTVPASLAGLPAVNVPIPLAQEDRDEIQGITSAGMQLISQYGHDNLVLHIASALECYFQVKK